MSVELDPPELHFKRPFTREVSQVLRLQNPHSDPVAFKVKTTAPKQYCVRPNSGRIEAGGDVEVQVLLQAMKEDPPLDAKCRDKFLVQTVAITAEHDFGNTSALWTHMEQTSKTSIHEKKIRVQFMAADAATPAKAANGGNYLINTSSIPNSPSSPEAVTPAPVNSRSVESPSSTAAQTPAASGVLASASDSTQSQLTQAQDQIARLTQQLKEQGELRQRKVANTLEEKGYPQAAQAVAHPQASGVPLQWVAALSLLSFLIAYLFF